MTELPDDGPALTDHEAAALSALDFHPTCGHEGCDAEAVQTMHAFHRASPYGFGHGEECVPSRYGYCEEHARALRRLTRWQYLVCGAHESPVVTRFTPGPPA